MAYRRYYDDERKQTRYENRVKILKKAIKIEFGANYINEFHQPLIMQLVRLELEMEELEMLLIDNVTDKDVRGWLKDARNEYNKKVGQLNMSMKDLRKDPGKKKTNKVEKKDELSFFGGLSD